MHKPLLFTSILAIAAVLATGAASAASFPEALAATGAERVQSIEFEAAGKWFQFGQAPIPGQAWPQFDVSSYDAKINYETAEADVKIVRKQTIDPARERPVPVEQRLRQVVSGRDAWNIAQPAANAAPGAQPTVTSQTAAAEERLAEIWATPQGFLRAAHANNVQAKPVENGLELSFTLGGKCRYTGFVNAKNQVESVKTWIDNPVLGDILIETAFSDYKDFDGVPFPGRITRSQGGFPVLDLAVSSVKVNKPVDITVPGVIATLKPASIAVTNLADGVYYLTGGTHHSVLIEQKDHLVLVEAPLNEDQSLALAAKSKEIAPNKPIKYVINSHVHFDHSGGLRTFVAQGATIVTQDLSKAYYEKVWANPHTIKPDALAKEPKPAQFLAYADKTVLGEGDRHKIELYRLAGSGHADDLAAIYLPGEKLLIEGDAYTPPAAGAPLPATPNPYSVNLLENIEKRKLNVERIAALHGPRVATLADLKTYIGVQTQ